MLAVLTDLGKRYRTKLPEDPLAVDVFGVAVRPLGASHVAGVLALEAAPVLGQPQPLGVGRRGLGRRRRVHPLLGRAIAAIAAAATAATAGQGTLAVRVRAAKALGRQQRLQRRLGRLQLEAHRGRVHCEIQKVVLDSSARQARDKKGFIL